MESLPWSPSAQAGLSSEATATATTSTSTSRLDPSTSSSALHHKHSLATTRSTSSISSSSHYNPNHHPTSSPAHQTQLRSNDASNTRSKRVPIYVRIVPKDVWMRIHVDATQSIGSIKDAALAKANVPDHDPSLSHRFYQDALNASAHAKLAPVASHDKVVKHRSYALPRSFTCPPPDLTHVPESLAQCFAQATSARKQPLKSPQPIPSSTVPPLPPFPIFDAAASPQRRPTTSPGSNSKALPLLDTLAAASSPTPRSMNDDGMAPSSTPSLWQGATDIGVTLDASLITGNRDAKLEEDMARLRLSQWNARRGTASGSDQHTVSSSLRAPQMFGSPADSINSTPTVASSSHFGDSAGLSPNVASSSGHDTNNVQGYTASIPAAPPRRTARSGTATGTAPAIFYTQPGASDSFNSLASISSPSSVELLTTADDDASVMQWGTQAEASLSDQPSPSRSMSSAAFSPLSSPLEPAATTASPSRPRSRTVTGADVLRSRSQTETEPLPLMPDAVSSPVRNSSLPKAQASKMVAESSQRRAVHADLLKLLKGTPDGTNKRDGDDQDDDDDEDEDIGYPTIKQRHAFNQKSFDSALSASGGAGAEFSSPTSSHSAKFAGGAGEMSGGGWKDASHPLSSKFAVLSAANGCELQEWQTARAVKLRAYELLELQWAIPTERVYIPPINLHDTLRVSASASFSASSTHGGMFTQSWGSDEMDAGPDPDAVCLEPYFEGWVYVLKPERMGKTSSKAGKWKLHYVTVKGWRMDLYAKKPRAGEAVLPVTEQVWSLRAIEWVVDSENAIPSSAALPALDTLPGSSLTVSFSRKGATPSSIASSEGSTLTVRCITQFDHDALSTLLQRAWYRCSALGSSVGVGGVDNWRRKAVFRALVAGRGGTVAAGRMGYGAGRGRGRGRNSRARVRLRPSGWAKEWEDADRWSSEEEQEQVAPPPELEHAMMQNRRDTVTQLKADRVKLQQMQKQKRQDDEKEKEKAVVPNGLYAALLGRTQGTSMASQSEPGTMLGGADDTVGKGKPPRPPRQRRGSMSSSPQPDSDSASRKTWSSSRARSLTVSGQSRSTTRQQQQQQHQQGDSSPSRKSSGSGEGFAMAPSIAAGWVDISPPPSLLHLKKYKAATASTTSTGSNPS